MPIAFATELSYAPYMSCTAAGVLSAFFYLFFLFFSLLRLKVLDYDWVSKKARMNADLLCNAMIDNVSALVSPLWEEATSLVFSFIE